MPVDSFGFRSSDANPVVDDVDDGVALLEPAPDRDAAVAKLLRETVLDRVLDERLQQHARDDQIQRGRIDVLLDAQGRAEANDLDVEVLVDRVELFTKRDEMLLAAEQPPEQPRELRDEHPRGFGLRPNQRRDRRQRVEQEMRIDLARERVEARGHEQLFLLLQAMLDACAVPDLDWNRDG